MKCGSLLHQFGSEDGNIQVHGYSDPALEGANVTFECSSPQLVLIGPNSITCVGNGEWEPDPRHVKCVGKKEL